MPPTWGTEAATTAGSRRRARAGVTLIELLIVLVVSTVVVGSVLPLISSQVRAQTDQRGRLDARETLRAAAAALTWELRQISASGGDLSAMDSTTLTVRSTQAFGVVCVRHATLPRLGVQLVDGAVAPGDSALAFSIGEPGPRDDVWRSLTVQNTVAVASSGAAICDWGTDVPDLVAEVAGDTTGIVSGAPFRSFVLVDFGLFNADGRTWIGRRLSGTSTWETLAGPVNAPAEGGLRFRYLDAAASETADPALIRMIEITLRSQSQKRSVAIGSGGNPAFRQDSLQTRVLLRG